MTVNCKFKICLLIRLFAMVAITASVVFAVKAFMAIEDSLSVALETAGLGFGFLILTAIFEWLIFRMSSPYGSLQEMNLFVRIARADAVPK